MINSSHVVVLARETDVYLACEQAATLAASAGFDRYRCADIETAVSEICSNALRHADGGWATIRILGGRFEVVVTDRGPGFSSQPASSRGLGVGLEGAGRLMGTLTIDSLPDGSRVTISHELPSRTGTDASAWAVTAVFRAKSGQAAVGDAAVATELGDRSIRVALADGLGSGAEAAKAARRVLDELKLVAHDSPSEALKMADIAARDTRGAAAAVVFVTEQGEGLHAGLGDVSCQITSPAEHLPSRPGFVGSGDTAATDTAFDLVADSAVLLWTDGLHLVDRQWRRLPPDGAEVEWMEGIVLSDGDPRDDAALVLVRRRP